MKATAIAPANIAFIKYWGKKDEELRLPTNGSISMNLSNLLTTTTVEFDQKYLTDLIEIDGKKEKKEVQRVAKHLNLIRKKADIKLKAKVITQNNFPSGTGLSSSASGFAALTVASVKAVGLSLSERELTTIARIGSGSACRSIPDGYTEWTVGNKNNESYAYSIYPPDYWDLVDIVIVVSHSQKEISTTDGMKLAHTSPFFEERLRNIKNKIEKIKKLIRQKDFINFGELIEAEALEMHTIMLTSVPPLIYWLPNTVAIMKLVQQWRKNGLLVYFTINTGQDVHIIAEKKTVNSLLKRLKEINFIKQVIVNFATNGTRLVEKHLF